MQTHTAKTYSKGDLIMKSFLKEKIFELKWPIPNL